MKKSLNSKVLLLSLSAILVVSGCERRGRAPVKGLSPAPLVTTETKPSIPLVAPSTTPSTVPVTNADDKKPVIDTKEADLVLAAQMACDVASIDENGKISATEFSKDLDLANKFKGCMDANGIKLICTDETGLSCDQSKSTTRNWGLDASPNPADKSAAYTAFAALSKRKGSNDDEAYKIMASRLALSVIRLGKMGTKYSESHLKDAGIALTDEADYTDSTGKKGKVKIGSTLADLATVTTILDGSKDAIKALKTVDATTDQNTYLEE